jgi:hypothetical protein
MAACNLATLESSACLNGFWGAAQSDVIADAVELQLLYLISGSSKTVAQLEVDACANGFLQVAQTVDSAEAAKLQLYCQISGG